MHRTLRGCAYVIAAFLTVACGRHEQTAAATPAGPPLATFAAQRVVLTPVGVVRADTLGIAQQLGGTRLAARALDSAIVAVLDARGLARRWILPADLARSFERNRTYATDPYLLAVEPLRSAKFVTGERYGEPLSSQLRTMIALHEDARLVLLPIELRFERQGAAARGMLKSALIDPRYAQATWVGEVKGDPAGTAALAIANVASRLVDLFIAP